MKKKYGVFSLTQISYDLVEYSLIKIFDSLWEAEMFLESGELLPDHEKKFSNLWFLAAKEDNKIEYVWGEPYAVEIWTLK